MKIAARFPVKSYPPLARLIGFGHLLLLSTGWCYLYDSDLRIIFALLVVYSARLSFAQYRSMTKAPDDLCWSGENWLMQNGKHQGQIAYLDLVADTWVSGQYCLARFNVDGREFTWLFARGQLGDALFSELAYLLKLSIRRLSEERV